MVTVIIIRQWEGSKTATLSLSLSREREWQFWREFESYPRQLIFPLEK